MDTEHDFWQTQRQLVAAYADAVLAGQREFESAAQREAMNEGDRRAGQRFEVVEDLLCRAHQLESLLGILELYEFLDVGASDETGRLRRTNHHAPRGLCRERAQMRIELDQRVARQRIGGGAGAIEAQPRDIVTIDSQGPG